MLAGNILGTCAKTSTRHLCAQFLVVDGNGPQTAAALWTLQVDRLRESAASGGRDTTPEAQVFDLVLLGLANMLPAVFVVFASEGTAQPVVSQTAMIPQRAPVILIRRRVIVDREHFDICLPCAHGPTACRVRGVARTAGRDSAVGALIVMLIYR